MFLGFDLVILIFFLVVCYDGVMANVETTRHFNVYGFGTSLMDEICMKLNDIDFISAKIYGDEIEVKSDVLSAEVIGDIFSLTARSVFF